MIQTQTYTLTPEQKHYFEQLIQKHHKYWEKYTLSKTKDADLAEELIQQVYLTLCRAIAKGTTIQHPLSYGTTAINNTYLSWCRTTRTRRKLLPLQSLENLNTSLPDTHPTQPQEQPNILEKLIEECNKHNIDPTLIINHELHDKSYDDLAKEQNSSKAHIKKHIYTTKQKIRQHISCQKLCS